MNTASVTSPVHLSEIGQIAITVSDLVRSRDFYQNVLGIQFLFEAGGMSFFQCGKVRLALGTSDKPVSASGTILYFRVPDIEQAYSQLISKEVEFLQKPHLVAKMADHDLWLAFLLDPDSNAIALMSEVPRTAVSEK